MQEQVGNVSREMKILRKNNNNNKKLEIKNTVTEMKNAFDKLITDSTLVLA